MCRQTCTCVHACMCARRRMCVCPVCLRCWASSSDPTECTILSANKGPAVSPHFNRGLLQHRRPFAAELTKYFPSCSEFVSINSFSVSRFSFSSGSFPLIDNRTHRWPRNLRRQSRSFKIQLNKNLEGRSSLPIISPHVTS